MFWILKDIHKCKSVAEILRTRLTTVQRIELSSDYTKENLFKRVLKADMDNIRTTMNDIDLETFDDAVNSIIEAKHVYIVA